ncbi:hypothetical protein, partial [Streptomyces ureilyticus]|uniref:hypothetical protein n=1 Tax=Streptomyces ureilyticus TaxID=1775131 RepID=UPI0019D19947
RSPARRAASGRTPEHSRSCFCDGRRRVEQPLQHHRHTRPAPLPGEHTAQVLAETGRKPEQIKKLFDAEVVR